MVNRFKRFSFAMFEISRCWHKLAAEEMAKYGLKGPHAVYLITMEHYTEGITAAQMSELCSRDKADVSRAMSQLEVKGLVVREGKGPYRARLKLTAAGKKAAAHLCKRAGLAVELSGKGICDAHREIFYTALECIAANMQSLSKEGLPGQ